LGLALEKQGKNEESEEAYMEAAKSKAADALVWQGLIALYEKQNGNKVDEYGQSALHLAEHYMRV
jgi:superkiller protein 3